ncbi:MAG: GNAT family N-acetyltransferase [Devosia sp.]|uniref:GNAT family N-acetyltransferase n=1 Tax=Devosia sp. TaxID=1871048 RepID=UPI001ACDF65A|nr:GNAT family protein [Devosia sp.]MBN9316079.1 GNAT family N-acetyltransferase [Devosia sp.]
MTVPDFPIETKRLVLRPFLKSDLEAVMQYHALPEVQRYLDWKARDRVEVKSALEAMVQQHRFQRPGDAVILALVRRADNALIGQASLRWVDATAGQAELRFIVGPAQRRQGYAREAVREMLDLGFEQLGLHRVFARCSARNQASANLLRSVGMRLEAHYREHALFQGEWDEELHFAILDREWLRGSKVKEIHRNMVA